MFISAYMHKTMITMMPFLGRWLFLHFHFWEHRGVLGCILFRYPRCMPFLVCCYGYSVYYFWGGGVIDGVVDICFGWLCIMVIANTYLVYNAFLSCSETLYTTNIMTSSLSSRTRVKLKDPYLIFSVVRPDILRSRSRRLYCRRDALNGSAL
jgi:hypothetical protein